MKTLLLILSLALAVRGNAEIFYLDSAGGRDSHAGTAPDKAWKTLAKASSRVFRPGDSLLLKRGGTWKENLNLAGLGTAAKPILLGAYGSGPRPRIDAGGKRAAVTSDGAIACWKISGLELTNSAAGNPQGKHDGKSHGIQFRQSEPSALLVIEDCLIHDTDGSGIKLQVIGKPKAVFSGLRIAHCDISNAWCGISFDSEVIHGNYHLFFPRFYIAHVNVHDTGADGITPFFGYRGMVEHCRAWRTGLGWSKRSPVGIWLAFDRESVIQFCESWDNHSAGQAADGGGFDIDGGSTGSIMQYNYSHGNEGAGFLVCSFDPTTWPTKNCITRYNLSVNDGLSNGYGAIVVWQANDCQFYNNTCITTNTSPLRFMEKTRGNLFANNLFIENSGKTLPLIRSDAPVDGNIFRNNLFWSWSRKVGFELAGAKLDSLASFEKSVKGSANLAADPVFFDARKSFYLKAASPARGRGLELPGRGERDYFGNRLVAGQPVDMGFAQTK